MAHPRRLWKSSSITASLYRAHRLDHVSREDIPSGKFGEVFHVKEASGPDAMQAIAPEFTRGSSKARHPSSTSSRLHLPRSARKC